MKIHFSLYLLLISVSVFSQWTWQNPLPQGNRLNSVTFIDANTGFSVGESGTIMRTTDGGETWKKIWHVVAEQMVSVYFPSPNIGYAAGFYGEIIKTTNGGETWNVSSKSIK